MAAVSKTLNAIRNFLTRFRVRVPYGTERMSTETRVCTLRNTVISYGYGHQSSCRLRSKDFKQIEVPRG
jgi:hypothetical protein